MDAETRGRLIEAGARALKDTTAVFVAAFEEDADLLDEMAAAVVDALLIEQVGTGRLGTEPAPDYSGWYMSGNTASDPEGRWVPVFRIRVGEDQ